MPATDSVISLGVLPSLLAGCLVLLLGDMLCRRIRTLERFSIPGPVVGGLVFALGALVLFRFTGLRVSLVTDAKGSLLLLFFASLGLTADMRLVAQAGPQLFRFLSTLVPALVAQNLLGMILAKLMGLHPFLGLIVGSITLVGGHGTGAAYADRYGGVLGISGIMELTMISATLGLVFGGIVGGPVGERLIRRANLSSTDQTDGGSVILGPSSTPVTMMSLFASLACGLVAVIAGRAASAAAQGAPVAIPDFLLCLFGGLLLRNLGAPFGLRLNDAASELIGSVCLSLFLAWTMMVLDLGSVLGSATPLLVIVICQVVLVVLWAKYVVFKVMGRNYEGAMLAAAFCGFGLGATATAIANMQAIASRNGPAPRAFLIVTIVGAFFIDILNAIVLAFFLSLPFLGLA